MFNSGFQREGATLAAKGEGERRDRLRWGEAWPDVARPHDANG